MQIAANDLRDVGLVLLDAKLEVPNQKRFITLLNFSVNDELRIAQRNVHLGEDVLGLRRTGFLNTRPACSTGAVAAAWYR